VIIKQFDLKKNIIREINFFLLYGKNIGLIEDTIKNSLKPILPKNIFNYEENDILKNIPSFRENLVNKSFFESEKLIIINRVTDRLFNLIKELTDQNIRDISIILVSDGLEKKSKIRNFFEKSKQTICIPFYEDNIQTLSLVAQKFLRERKIDVSQQDLNTLAERAKGDRINLRNELEKIESFSLNKKKIGINEILKLTNLSENYDISELLDNCLSRNKKKINKIFNENNFNQEDCLLILRIFLSRLKRLLKLYLDPNIKINIDKAISSHKPTIFWKDKEILKKQIKILNFEKIKELIYKTNKIELIIKKNPNISINVTTDFIVNQAI
jgi:DNA polymerase-3 subunit delta